MVGLLPSSVRMVPRRLSLGYADVELTAAAPFGPAGSAARGHEFHVSTLEPVPADVRRVYRVRTRGRAGDRAEGYLVGRALMSYVHLHFASNPMLPRAFVDACADCRA
jgi:cobyrinic acid a,c-diamide synthase